MKCISCEGPYFTLRSRCTMLVLCMYWTPSQICLTKRMQSRSVRLKSSATTRSNNSPPDILQKILISQCTKRINTFLVILWHA